MRGADFVVALSAFRSRALDYADVLLPIAPFTETAGSFVSTEGRLQSFKGVVQPLGETRPAWKVLRVLGNLLGVSGFEFDSAEEVRDEALQGVDMAARLSNVLLRTTARSASRRIAARACSALPRCRSTSPMRWCAARRPLQQTADAAAPVASLPGEPDGAPGPARRRHGAHHAGRRRSRAACGAAMIASRRAACASPRRIRLRPALGAMFGAVELERVPAGTRSGEPDGRVLRANARSGRVRDLDAGQDRGHRGAADAWRGLSHAGRAQGHRLHAGAHRPEPGRADGSAAADRRRAQAPVQGDHHPVGREQVPVRAGAGDGDHAGARRPGR